MTRRHLLLAALAPSGQLDLKEIAAIHVAIAQRTQRVGAGKKVWGRIGGTTPEHESAAALVKQLQPFVGEVKLEPFRFSAHRALDWEVKLDGKPLETAMPAPFEARFPERLVSAPLAPVDPDEDWAKVSGKWAFVSSRATTSTAFNIVREKLLYQRAVAAGAVGLLFAIPTPTTSRWKSVVPVDKPYAVKDERYPGGRRPIPCFSIDATDGKAVAGAQHANLSATIRYDPVTQHEGRNVVGFLPGSADFAVAVMCHIDSFFTGACDNASGVAAMVGIAESLSRLPRNSRKPGFYFLGLSAHHDEAAGMRDWVARDPDRFARIRQLFLLEHVDALDSEEGRRAGWKAPLNDNRTAYVGPDGWPELKAMLPALVKECGVMSVAPPVQDACIADLFVTCGRAKSFCLMNTPPFYHTDHDTLDRVSASGIRHAAELHLKLFRGLKLI